MPDGGGGGGGAGLGVGAGTGGDAAAQVPTNIANTLTARSALCQNVDLQPLVQHSVLCVPVSCQNPKDVPGVFGKVSGLGLRGGKGDISKHGSPKYGHCGKSLACSRQRLEISQW